jgi:hypothetical protein
LYAKEPQGQRPAVPTGRTGGGRNWKATLTPPANAFGNQRRNAAKSKLLVAAKNFYFKYMKTPQTDDIARGNHVVPTEWAQQLERERDEAREALMKIEDLFIDGTDIYADRENMGLIAIAALEEIK